MREEQARQQAAEAQAAREESERQAAERLAAAQQQAAQQRAAAQTEAARDAASNPSPNGAATSSTSRSTNPSANASANPSANPAPDAAASAAAKRDEARAYEAQREERLRAIGRQLNEEADRRAATEAAAAARPSPDDRPSSWSSARRGRIYGRSDANEQLTLYAQAFSRKIELNMTFDAIREVVRQRHTPPVVTVAVRSDGSVESVSFVRASGVAAIDDAVRRVVQSQANYPAFSPALAREFDVVEIRRTWHFDMAIRLY
jgi:TonB family protein